MHLHYIGFKREIALPKQQLNKLSTPSQNSSIQPKAGLEKAQKADHISPLRHRLMAMLYDAFLLIAMLLCITMVYLFVASMLSGGISEEFIQAQEGDVLKELEPIDLGWPYYLLILVMYSGFYCFFWKKTGQTLGMQAWKIQLVNQQAGRITFRQCLLRLLVSWLSFFVIGLGYFTLIINRNGGTWHDRASKTYVKKIPKQ